MLIDKFSIKVIFKCRKKKEEKEKHKTGRTCASLRQDNVLVMPDKVINSYSYVPAARVVLVLCRAAALPIELIYCLPNFQAHTLLIDVAVCGWVVAWVLVNAAVSEKLNIFLNHCTFY